MVCLQVIKQIILFVSKDTSYFSLEEKETLNFICSFVYGIYYK